MLRSYALICIHYMKRPHIIIIVHPFYIKGFRRSLLVRTFPTETNFYRSPCSYAP